MSKSRGKLKWYPRCVEVALRGYLLPIGNGFTSAYFQVWENEITEANNMLVNEV